jgi:hypothetical protein
MYTCSKKKPAFKNLTVGKEYEGIEDGEMVVVVNDIGARARYSKEYFTGTVEAAPRRGRPARAAAVEAPPPPPPPPAPILENILQVNITRDERTLLVQLSQINGAVNNRFRFGLSLDGSTISCGIYQVSNISNVGNLLNNFLESLPQNTVNRNMNVLTELVMTRVIAYVKATQNAAYWLFSDAVADDDDPDCFVQVWLDENCVSRVTDNNPNSGNTITLWVIGATEGGV